MQPTTAERIAKRFVSLPVEQRKQILDKMIESGQSFRLLPIVPTHQDVERIPLSYAQQRLFFMWQMEPESSFYNVPMAVRLTGRLDDQAMTRALELLVLRHESLRTRFTGVEGEFYQDIQAQSPVTLDIQSFSERPTEQALQAFVHDELARPFDLVNGPVMRARLVHLGEAEHLLTVCMHHIVSDGWSSELVVSEFVQLYTALVEGSEATLPELPIQYADYAIWQRSWLEAGEGARQLDYWKQQLGEEQPVLDLPLDRDRPASPSYRAAVVAADIPQALAAELRALARKNGNTLFMLVLAAVAVVLSRYSGQADIRIGAPNASRNRTELEGLIGFFINTQVLRVQVNERSTFAELIDQVRDVVTGAQSHQDLPFEQLVDALLPERNLGYNPLFQFKINQNVQSADNGAARLGGITVDAFPLGEVDAHFDLAFDFTDTPAGIDAAFTYATDLFDEPTIERMAASLRATLEALVREPDARLLDHVQNSTGALEASQQSFPCNHFLELWQRGLALGGQGEALRAGTKRVSYAQLESDSNRLAGYLRTLGVATGSVVALCQERGIEWVTAMLAVLKAGGAYLPLDSQQPAERLQQLLHDSGAHVLLHQAQDTRFADVQGVQVLPWNPQVWADYSAHALEQSLTPEQPAYLIYTSGSTGQPKGVQVSHGALSNYVQAVLDRLQLAAEGSLAMVSTVAADLGHTMLFGALASGRLLHLLPHDLAFDPDGFAAYMAEHQVAVLKLVPSHLHGLLQAASPADVLPEQLLVLGGESCSWELVDKVRQLRPGCRVVNHYGPTETTVGVLTHEVRQRLPGYRSVPVGLPLANGCAAIFDAWLNPSAQHVAGELYLGGHGLAQGYKGRAALTAERFIPTENGQRLYRTGDRARMRADGLIEFIGRSDDQVKIRGYRVEPREISQLLLGLAGVNEAVVLPLPLEGDPSRLQLVAYCLVTPGLTVADLQLLLQQRLPDYMVPAQIILLERLPLTANGKLDKRALPKPGAVSGSYVAPQGEIECILADVWAQVLKRDQVGTTDNFFELGGDSILSLQIIARAKRQGIKLTPKQVFEQQTIGQLAKVAKLIEARPPATQPVRAVEKRAPLVVLSAEQLASLPVAAEDIEDIYPLSPMQQGMLFHSLLDKEAGHYINQLRVDVQGLDVKRFKAAWQGAISRHEALRANFVDVDGPLQVIRKRVDAPCTVLDWRTQDDVGHKLDEWALEDRRQGFDLARDSMLRLALIRTGDNTHHLIHTTHHILLDGWSNSQLMGEILQSYTGATLAPVASQYRDYIEWLGKQDAAVSETFWKAQLSGLEEPTLLVRSIRQPQLQADSGYGYHPLVLGQQQTAVLSDFAQRQRVTVNTLVQAAWILLLQGYTGQDSVACGVTVSGRPGELDGVEQQLGLFINTLPLIARPLPEQSVAQWLQTLQSQNLALREYEHTPLYDVQRWAGKSGEALFDTLLMFDNYPVSQALEKGVSHGLVFNNLNERGQTSYGLVIAANLGEVLTLGFNYAGAEFSDSTVKQLALALERLLLELTLSPQRAVGQVALLASEDAAQLVQQFNSSEVRYPAAQCLHQLIEQQVSKTPDATAVAFDDQALSYAELNQRANRLAHKLREQGVGPDVLVGLAVERSLEMVVGLLAILKAGGAYVPLDPEYPQERLSYLMQDSGIGLLLTQSHLQAQLPVPESVQVLSLDEVAADLLVYSEANPVNLTHPDNLAYVIYTSGSTGKPKGTLLAHHNVVRLFQATEAWFQFNAQDVWMVFHSYAFDFSVWELYGALLYGGKAVIVAKDVARSPEHLHALLKNEGVTVLNQTPSAFKQLIPVACDSDADLALRYVVFGGEALDVGSLAPWFERFGDQQPQLINMYGITETTVHVTYRPLCKADLQQAAVSPLGEVIPDLSWYLLDGQLNPAVPGVQGELHIGRAGLARGYHNRAALTAERFIPNPFDTSAEGGSRLYRSGDLGRSQAGGAVEYAGRIDHQVKIRGFRIELGEIEARVKEHPGVREAVVLDIDGPVGKQLVAYLVPVAKQAAEDQQAGLRDSLRETLKALMPDYMVPAHFVCLEALPLTGNGKLDRRALPKPAASVSQYTYVAPRTELEQQMASIWAEVLQVERVGLTDNFFELGGHSLLALSVLSRVRLSLGTTLNPSVLFQYPVLEAFAGQLVPEDTSDFEAKLKRLDLFAEELEDVQ